MVFIRVSMPWEKGNTQTFGSELTMIPRDSKHRCSPPVRVEAYGNQVIRVLIQI